MNTKEDKLVIIDDPFYQEDIDRITMNQLFNDLNKEAKTRILLHRSEKQSKLCEKKGYPNFVGDGNCSCGHNIFEKEDGSSLVTGCPFCCKSFCE